MSSKSSPWGEVAALVRVEACLCLGGKQGIKDCSHIRQIRPLI